MSVTEFLTVPEVAAILRVSEETIYRIKADLGGFFVGTGAYRGRLRFSKAGIEAYVESRRCRQLTPVYYAQASQARLDNARQMRALVTRRIAERRVEA